MNTENLISYLSSIHSVSDEFKQFLSKQTQEYSFKKGQPLKDTLRSSRVWYVEKGMLKASYFDQDGKERVTRFWHEDEIILIESNAYKGIPSADYLIMLENTTLLSLPDNNIGYALRHFREAQTLKSLIFQMDRDKSEVLAHLLHLPLNQAYEKFETIFPVNRIPVQDVAHYLGTSPKRISEIRGRK
jgi:CRP-like cAMP-binding protein